MLSIPNQTLRLVQFNVENLFLFLDHYQGQNLDLLSESDWQKLRASTIPNKPLRKIRALREAINDIKPDILMLNEVGGIESLENFNRHFLDSRFHVCLKEGNSKRGIDIGYLLNKDLPFRSVLISHKDRPIQFLYPHESQTPAGGQSHYFSRDIAELRLFKPEQTTPFLVLLLAHLKSKLDTDRIDSEGKLRRAAELNTLVQIYNEIRSEINPKIPIVVAGDFNGIASKQGMEPEFLPLHNQTDLIDCFDLCELSHDKRFTQVQISHSGRQNCLQFDYQFISPELSDRVVKSETYVYLFKNELGQATHLPKNLEERSLLMSDHYPVVLTIKI